MFLLHLVLGDSYMVIYLVGNSPIIHRESQVICVHIVTQLSSLCDAIELYNTIHVKWNITCSLWESQSIMMTSSNGNIFRVTGPLCGEFTGPGEFPTQRPVTRSFDVFFDLRLNKRLSKQPWGWRFETLSWSLWRQCNVKRSWHGTLFHMIDPFLCNTVILQSMKYVITRVFDYGNPRNISMV